MRLRSRWPALAAASAGALLAAGCSNPSPPPATGVGPARSSAGPAVTTPVPELTAMLLPATGAETRGTQGLAAFLGLVADRAAARCAAARGTVLPDRPPAQFVRLFALPDLEYIRRHGFGVTTPAVPLGAGPPPAWPSPGAVPPDAAGAAAARACREAGERTVAPARELVAGLQGAWFGTLAGLDAEPAVAAARAGIGPCLRARGVDAADEQAFFDRLDRRLSEFADATAAAAEERTLAGHYAACLQPVETLREGRRRQLRRAFEAGHRDELAAARARLPGLLQALRAGSGVPLSFPSP